jgi:polar amino acid transport system permease protein
MSQCLQTIQDYGLRSIGIGEKLLPKHRIHLCEQVTLIGSGLIWNLYFGVLALLIGFFTANALALAKASRHALDAQTGRMVHLPVPRQPAVHPVLPGL